MYEKLASSIAHAIRQARLRAGLSQVQLAGQLGLPALLYARLERGKLLPGCATLRTLSEVLHTPADVLVGLRHPDGDGACLEAEVEASLRALLRAARKAGPAGLKAFRDTLHLLLHAVEQDAPPPGTRN